MNEKVAKSYFRSIQRGTRTLEQVPEEMREEVAKLCDAWMNSQVEAS